MAKKFGVKEQAELRAAVTAALHKWAEEHFEGDAHVVEIIKDGVGVSLPDCDILLKCVVKKERIDFDAEFDILAEREQKAAERKAKAEKKAKRDAERRAKAAADKEAAKAAKEKESN